MRKEDADESRTKEKKGLNFAICEDCDEKLSERLPASAIGNGG